MRKKKIKKYYSYKKFMKACRQSKEDSKYQLIFLGPDAEKISKEVDDEHIRMS